MTKSGGKGKGGQKRGDDLGRALIKMHIQGSYKTKPRYANKMVSILDNNALDDFIDTAEMDGDGFEVQRVHQNHAFLLEATTHKSIQTLTFSAFKHEQLSIPRKPAWNKNMTAEDVDRNEKNAFLQWRREIAALEESHNHTKKVTPFEKNLEVWRQLWRVCERSDLIVQIVDGRNPLLYYTRDLMRYVSELNPPKKMILLVNKADFLTEYQRLVWAQYFNSIGVRFVFYSAHIEQSKLDAFGLVEDFENPDVNEAEIVWLAKDLVENYDVNAGKTSTEGIVFDPTSVEGYLASERSLHQEESAAVKAAVLAERARPQTIPEEAGEAEEESSEGDESEDEEDGSDEGSDAEQQGAGPSEVSGDKEGGQPVTAADADAEEEEDGEDDADFAAYVQKTQTRKLRAEADADAEDGSEGEGGDQDEEGQSGDEQSQEAHDQLQSSRTVPAAAATSLEQRRARLLTRGELLLLLETVAEELQLQPQPRHEGRVCIGLVGYPNVGKSSCINTLLGVCKNQHGKVRVGVSSTPGKTKHFQTLVLSDTIMLCDCPGLVFPSFMNSTGEMLCAGILPINQMKDYEEPAAVIASRIPQYLLEAALGIRIYRHLDPLDRKDRPPTPTEFLSSYCESRGLITNGTGRWDEFRACKELLVLYTDGKLLSVAVPPFVNLASTHDAMTAATAALSSASAEQQSKAGVATDILQRWVRETERVMTRRAKVAERMAGQKTKAAAAAVALAMAQESTRRPDQSEMVFDYTPSVGSTADEPSATSAAVRTDANGYEYVDESSDDDGEDTASQATGINGQPKREHKRIKTWGKKNRKLREKDPYADVNMLVAYSTNRAKGPSAPVATGGKDKGNNKITRHSVEHAYGSPFVRAVLPHHTLGAVPTSNTGASSNASVASKR